MKIPNKVFIKKAKLHAQKVDQFMTESINKNAKWIFKCPRWIQSFVLLFIFKLSRPVRVHGKILYKVKYFGKHIDTLVLHDF